MAPRPYSADPHAPLPPHLDPRGRHRGAHGSRLGAFKFVGGTFLVLLSVSCLLLSGFAWWNFHALNNGLHRLHIATRQGQTSHNDIDGEDQNILLVGNDDRSNLSLKEARELHVGLDGGSLATDTMMIVHVPADGSKAQIISLPRDAYVRIPGHGMNKLNAAYVDGYNSLPQGSSLDERRTEGADLLIRTISDLTGLTIDHFVQVSLIGFVKISDAVGGVTINLCHAVDDSVAANVAGGFGTTGSGFKMSAGKHTIKGVQALEFVRQRHFLANGDIDRNARQRYFLTQAFRKIASAGTLLNIGRLSSLVKAIDQAIYVDDNLDVTKLAKQVSSLDPDNIVGRGIPFERFGTVDVGSVEIINPARVKRFVDRLINPPDTSKSSSAATSTPTSGATAGHKHKAKKPARKCIN
jgi:LCP family protein required for cell wall assembly